MDKTIIANSQRQNTFKIKIADLIVEISSLSPRTYVQCRKYISEGIPDIEVSISEEDVEYERTNRENNLPVLIASKSFVDKTNGNVISLSINNEIFLETVAAYRKIVEEAIHFNIFLMHGAVIAIDHMAFMFTAPSGTGKTTHIKKWLHNIPDAYVVNGDKPLIRIKEHEVLACGSPWCGNEHLSTNVSVPLKAIVLMERSEDNYIEEISFSSAYPYLLQQTYLPRDVEKAKATLSLLSRLYRKVKFYKFYFNNFKDDCFCTSYNMLFNK